MTPQGFLYVPHFLTELDESTLLAEIETYPFHDVVMRGQVARRMVIHFGWDYDYEGWNAAKEALITSGANLGEMGRIGMGPICPIPLIG